eukprot:14939268-Alexandrium_andersonii.AAC.1
MAFSPWLTGTGEASGVPRGCVASERFAYLRESDQQLASASPACGYRLCDGAWGILGTHTS